MLDSCADIGLQIEFLGKLGNYLFDFVQLKKSRICVLLAVNCSHDLETGMIHHFANGLVIVELRMNCHLRRMRALLFDPPKRPTGADLLRRRGNKRRPEERPGEKGRALFGS